VKAEIISTGVELYGYLPEKTYHASFPSNYDFSGLQRHNVYAVTKLLPEYKIDPSLYDASSISWAYNNGLYKVYVTINPKFSTNVVAGKLIETGVSFTRSQDESIDVLSLEASMTELTKMAAHPLIQYIEPISAPWVLEDEQGTSNHRSNATFTGDNYTGGRKLDGSGVVIALGDDGFIGPHIDFQGRIAVNASNTDPADTHGDHTAGIILAAPNMNPRTRGHAPGATLRAYDGYNDLVSFPTIYTVNQVRITSHSLGQTCNSGYNSNARTSDQQVRTYSSLMHVHSAGNSGNTTCGGLTGGWKTITGGYKAGKNVLAVANLTKSDIISSSSSKGPTPDNRIKPDISAVGSSVSSTQPNNTYASMSGTSMACPAVAGSLAVMYQAYKKANASVEPNSGLMKAIMLNTADDIGNQGPDFTFGWGRLNLLRAIECIEQNRYITGISTHGITSTHNITIPAGTAAVKFMVYWVDPEATSGANPALVNNLNMTVTSASVTYMPWLLDPGPSPTAAACSAPATTGVDNLNNVEQVEIESPAEGVYTVNIAGTNVPQGPQTYYLVYEFYKNNSVVVTHPFGGETFAPGESQRIRWDAYGDNFNFSIDYSTNGGSSWTPIASNVSSSIRYYDWTVPVINTSNARIRVLRSGVGDISDTSFTILGVPASVSFSQVCNGRSTISWSAVSGATGYDVFKLGDKFMDKVASTNTTSITLSDLGNSPNWFAVRAKLATNGAGRRTNAVVHTNSSATVCPSLPVKLISFSAAKKNNNVELSWVTTNEIGIYKYIVERSETPTFNTVVSVGEVAAKNVVSAQQYNLTDVRVNRNGISYYRLKIVEGDKDTYSKVASVKWDGVRQEISLYPNPATTNIYLYSSESLGEVEVEVLNAVGTKLKSFRSTVNAGSSLSVDVSNLAAGNYVLVVKGKDNSVISRERFSVVR
jgi:subtilisin family serine protease